MVVAWEKSCSRGFWRERSVGSSTAAGGAAGREGICSGSGWYFGTIAGVGSIGEVCSSVVSDGVSSPIKSSPSEESSSEGSANWS